MGEKIDREQALKALDCIKDRHPEYGILIYGIRKALEAKEPEQLRQDVERLTNSVIEMSKSIGMLKTESERFKDALKDIAYAKSKIYSIHHENYAIKIALEALAPQIEGK